MNPARLAAARTLLALERGRTTLSTEAERERPDIADARDRALFLEITAGTLRWRAEIDACLASHSRRSVDDFSPEARAVLRSGAYQLLHLDRVPAHAAVSEAVEIIRTLGQPRAAGFVNAVLRRISGPHARRALPSRPADSALPQEQLRYLSVTLSHPQWLVRRWLEREGFEAAERWCRFNNATPTVAIRAAPGQDSTELLNRLQEAGIEVTRARFAPDVYLLAAGGLGRIPIELRDSLLIQDEGSVLVALAAGVTDGDRVLDICAAPGGKTLIFAGAAGATGSVVASDVRPSRLSLLRRRVANAAPKVAMLAVDAATGLPFGAVFDRVVLDAPCSGLGTVRRDPDIKWIRQEADLARFAEAQARMLDQAALTVKPGGRLTYSTCSSEPDENEHVVDAFLSRSPDFAIEPIREVQRIPSALVTARGFLSTSPARDELDAFFAAKLVRSGGA